MDRRGFSLIEVAVTIAIVGVLASLTVGYWLSINKNAAVGDAALNVAAQLEGLRAVAMREGVPYGALVMDVTNNEPGMCQQDSRNCLRICIIRDPAPGWSAATSNPGSATLPDCTIFTNGVRFRLAPGNAPPRPFDTLPVHDPVLVPIVAGRRVLALRYETNGQVTPAVPGAANANGAVVVISSNATNAAVSKGVVVTFPYGLVRTYSY